VRKIPNRPHCCGIAKGATSPRAHRVHERVQAKSKRLAIRAQLSETLPTAALLVCLLTGISAPASRAATERVTPPPVSGRRLSVPESILPADVLARVELLRENVDLLRHYMGKSTPPVSLFRVESARPFEVYSQALNLQLRANRLAFEQVRVVRNESIPLMIEARPADVFGVVDAALAAVLVVKQNLGIETAVAEKQQPDTSTPSDVFNATIAAGSEINHLLEQRTSPSDVFQLVTAAVYTAAALHVVIPGGPSRPAEPSFEPNKMPSDVYSRMRRCFTLIRLLAESKGGATLRFEIDGEGSQRVSPNDVGDLASLIVEELTHLHRQVPVAVAPARAHYPGKRFPAHVYQRVGLLESILEDLMEAWGVPIPDLPAAIPTPD